MPRYAYIPLNSNFQPRISKTEIEEFQNRKVLKIDSTKILKEEYESLKKELKDGCYCYSCDSKMKLRSPKGKHQHFAHYSRQDCFEAESLAHASVKRNLFERFKMRGYKVAVERSFKSYNKQLFTDVAVMQTDDILAIEVQASPTIKLHTIAERTSTYAEAGIPTAWVVVLDSFFGEGNFTSTKAQVLVQHEDGSSSYEERLLPYSAPTPFIVTTDIPKSFLFIMDHYKYVIAVNHEGHFFMIRRVEVAGDVFEIFRIEQEKVVDSLLATEIKRIPYKADSPYEKPSHELEHTEGQHPEDEDWELEGEKLLKGHVINFDTAYQEESEQLKNEVALDILRVIKETKRREILHDKKRRLIESYNQLILKLLEGKSEIQSIYKEMEYHLSVQYQQIEGLIRERIRVKEIEEEVKRREEERERNRLKQLEYHKKIEEDRKEKEVAEIERKQKESEEKRAIQSLKIHIKQYFEFQSLDQLKQYYTPPIVTEALISDAYDFAQNKIEWAVNYLDFKRYLEDDIIVLFKQIVSQRMQEDQNRIKRESIHDQQEKDRLCIEIQEMQSKAGFIIIRNIEQLKMTSLKEIKKVYHEVERQYYKMSQLTLF